MDWGRCNDQPLSFTVIHVHNCLMYVHYCILECIRLSVPDNMIKHEEWEFDIKISNDNPKNEKRATIHVRSDLDGHDAVTLAKALYQEIFES